jgi:hypothetical protein
MSLPAASKMATAGMKRPARFPTFAACGFSVQLDQPPGFGWFEFPRPNRDSENFRF